VTILAAVELFRWDRRASEGTTSPSQHSKAKQSIHYANMNARRNFKQRRSVSSPIIRPFACVFRTNEVLMSSHSEKERAARRRSPTTGVVHIDLPKKLKETLSTSDDNDSIFQLRKPGTKRRGKKKTTPKKQVSTKTLQTSAMSSSVASASANCTRSSYRLPSRRGLVKRFSSRKTSPVKECVDDVIDHSSSSSSSCLTYTSNNEGDHDDSVDSDCGLGDKYEVEETEPPLTVEWQQRGEKAEEEESFAVSQASLHVQDCVEEQDALVLQLHIPSQDVSGNLDVEYLPFKIPAV
jgi:hypothetical protein